MIIKKPLNGDYEIERHFAFWRVELDKRHDVWLQNYYIVKFRENNTWKKMGIFASRADAEKYIKEMKLRPKERSGTDYWRPGMV